jgi:hypothetical protein
MDDEAIVRVFENKDVRQNILNKRKAKGVLKPKLPPQNVTEQFARMTDSLRQTLIVKSRGKLRPTFSPDAYFHALELFDSGYIQDFSEELRQFIQTENIAAPKAVFRGMAEIAQLYARSIFLDPVRTEFINENFGEQTSTQLITAYFEEFITQDTNHFPQIFPNQPLRK